MASATSDRLSLLADHIELGLQERARARSLTIEPDSKNTKSISKSLDALLQGIQQLEVEQGQLEERGDLSSRDLREREDILLALRRRCDDLHSKFNEEGSAASAAPVADTPTSTLFLPTVGTSHRSEAPLDEAAARDALMGSRTSPASMRKSVRFSENLVDTQELDNTQVLQLHRRIMEEQDESLDRLSESITRQRELSIQIGDELEGHIQLLDEVDELVDRHQTRLDGAGKKLKSFAKSAQEHGSLVVIVVLIIILILLIAILK
ncbi:hypothetical protein BDZ91DRAFT_663231 [Kalaharituber pfeilii]|nr:hypothetical protein BDZ91DRAFT_663231 [Kalaharituber pfeilii]